HERHLGLVGESAQPVPQHLTSGHEPAPLDLAGVAVPVVESDLSTMHVKPAYDGHRDLLMLPRIELAQLICCAELRGSRCMSSFCEVPFAGPARADAVHAGGSQDGDGC